MKTDDLIAALASDPARRAAPSRLLGFALLPAVAASLVAYALLLGPRPDLLDAAATPRFVFKLLVSVGLFVAALGAMLRLAAPGRRQGAWSVALLAVPALLVVAVIVELAVQPAGQWRVAWIGHNATWCLRVIPLLSLAPLVAAFAVLKGAAPTRPAVAGAVAGLLAGGLGAAIYATHCPDDSPLFVASWYSLAALGVAAVGGVLGSRLLRW